MGGILTKGKEFVQTVHKFVLLIILMRWINISIFFSQKIIDESNQGEAYSVDRIDAVCEQVAGFTLREVLDPRGEFYHNDHINRVSASALWGA